MSDEFEVISHEAGLYKVFLVNLLYRTPHIHKDFEVCLLLDGSVRLLSQGTEYTYEKGCLWVINPFRSHELAANQPALILSLQISPAFFASVFPQIENIEFSLPPSHSLSSPRREGHQVRQKAFIEESAQGNYDWEHAVRGNIPSSLSQTLLSIASSYFDPAPHSSLHCAGLICLLFEGLLAHLPSVRISEKERLLTASKAQRIRAISGYIDKHYSEKLLLTDLARELGLTMSYLSHFFKSSFGMSFQDYVMKMRCEKARHLLLLTDFSLLDISIACGFSDIKYFNRGFRSQFGCSPRQYRMHFEKEDLDQQQKSMLTTQEFLSSTDSQVILAKYLNFHFPAMESIFPEK